MTAPSRSRPSAHTADRRRNNGIRASSSGVELWIFDEIGPDGWGISARSVNTQLRDAGPAPVTVRISSPGGDAFEGIAIYEALRVHQGLVTVHVEGLAASAASVIAMAGDVVVMGPASSLMIHDASTMAWGNEAELRKVADLVGQTSDIIANVYAARAGGDPAAWRELMRTETWYTAKSAVESGLADRIADVDPLAVPVSDPIEARARRAAVTAAYAHRGHATMAAVQSAFRQPLPRTSARRRAPSLAPALVAMRAAWATR